MRTDDAGACELLRKARVAPMAALIAAVASPALVAAASEPAAQHEAAGLGALWAIVNFIILCGTLYYFLKTPLSTYLRDRSGAIRKDLVEAANLKATATAQLVSLEQKLRALPGEIDALRTRGAAESAAEERRIEASAAADRDRLLEQTRREIDVQLRLATRAMLEHAADLSVQLATERIERDITPADHARLVDRYLDHVKGPGE